MAVNPPDTIDTTSDASDIQVVNLELQKLLNDRENKTLYKNRSISYINNNTQRVVKNQVAGKKEFLTKRRKYLAEGSLYHTHYTTDLSVYYMSGGEHKPTTELIFRDNIQSNDFEYYNTLNKQKALTIKPESTIPTEEDYVVGKMIRYFAKKTNELSSPAFEIAADNYKLSPLYDYVSLEWQISGNKRFILIKNFKQIKVASLVIPNIRKLLPNYQYYRSGEKITSVQEVLSRLGTTGQQANGEQSNSQNNTQNESTGDKATGKGNAPSNQTSKQNSGAGAGTTTGGGGGGSSLY